MNKPIIDYGQVQEQSVQGDETKPSLAHKNPRSSHKANGSIDSYLLVRSSDVKSETDD